MTTLHLRKSTDRSPLQPRFLLIPLLLACFAAVFISIPTPAAAGGMVPFKGVVSGNIPADFAEAGGPDTRAVHEAYANAALVILPSLDEYEQIRSTKVISLIPGQDDLHAISL